VKSSLHFLPKRRKKKEKGEGVFAGFNPLLPHDLCQDSGMTLMASHCMNNPQFLLFFLT
jgi:hypothetical protein